MQDAIQKSNDVTLKQKHVFTKEMWPLQTTVNTLHLAPHKIDNHALSSEISEILRE